MRVKCARNQSCNPFAFEAQDKHQSQCGEKLPLRIMDSPVQCYPACPKAFSALISALMTLSVIEQKSEICASDDHSTTSLVRCCQGFKNIKGSQHGATWTASSRSDAQRTHEDSREYCTIPGSLSSTGNSE
eukprot:5314738-Amphidinium_carterae.1